MSNSELAEWLRDFVSAFNHAWSEVASKRLVDVTASMILAQIGAGIYGATRIAGSRPEEALREAENQLCRILDAAISLLRTSFETGSLEETYRRTVDKIGS